jgi:hypothetical protein
VPATSAAVLLFCVFVGRGLAEPAQFYVATDGNDSWSGRAATAINNTSNDATTDGPFATIARARDVIRQLRREEKLPEGAVVTVGEGTYVFTAPLELTSDDAGSQQAPIEYRAAAGKQVRLLGGRIVRDWKPVDDTAVLQRLDPAAREHVFCADLKQLGVSDFGSPAGGGIEVFSGGRAMTLARWPNEGFVPIVDVLGTTERDVRGTKGRAEGIFSYDGDRPARWAVESDAWVHGYWFWDWSEQRHKVKAIDAERHVIDVEPPYHGYGYRKGQWFYGFNLLCEIDQPGEWYVDRTSGALYFWPPAAIEDSEVVVSVIPALLTMTDVSYVTWRGFTMEAARGTAVTIAGGTDNRIVASTIRNVGGWAVGVSGGSQHGVVGCNMYQMGAGGVSLTGGDRATLTPAGHFADNNHIHHYARIERVYRPGITLQGVGNRATHNLIHDAPHMGMGFGGNDHVIELNEIHDVCYESSDAGAIYTGRDWTERGTVVRHNYLHDITGLEGRGCVGVYLDDMFCGTEISGNLFYRVTRAAFLGGGRDSTVTNNLFVDCQPALHIDARALGWAHDHSDAWISEGHEKGTLSGIHFNKPPYSERYPELVTILAEEPAAPRGNRVFANVSFGGKWDEVEPAARPYVSFADNLVDRDPGFVTPDRIADDEHPRPTDFALRDDSPAWSIGFEKLPLSEMGLYESPDRASCPARCGGHDGER